jgi:hypothetical protein
MLAWVQVIAGRDHENIIGIPTGAGAPRREAGPHLGAAV